MMNYKLLISIAVLIMVGGCAQDITCNEGDINGDSKTDLWIYKRGGVIEKTELDLNGDGQAEISFKWDADGRLLINTSERQREDRWIKNIYYHDEWQRYEVGEEIIWRNRMDIKRSYPKSMQGEVGAFFMYTVNNEPLFAETDTNNDGKLDKVIYYENFKLTKEPSKDLTEKVRKIRTHILSD